MSQVEESPMKVGHTYPNKEIALIRIAEEANLSGCMITIGRSCTKRVMARSDLNPFHRLTVFSSPILGSG